MHLQPQPDPSVLPTLSLGQVGPYQRLFSAQRAERIWLALIDNPDLPLERTLAFHIAQALAERCHKRVLLLELCGRDQAIGPHFAMHADQIRPSLLACVQTRSLLERHRAPTISGDGQHFPALALLTGHAETHDLEAGKGPDHVTPDQVAAALGEIAESYDYLLIVTTQTTPAHLVRVAAEQSQRTAVLISAHRGCIQQAQLAASLSLPPFAGSGPAQCSVFVAHVPGHPTMGMQDSYAAHLGTGALADTRLMRLLPADEALLARCWRQQATLRQVNPDTDLARAVDFVARHLARQTVGIAFGGGGARSRAHIGVMKRALERGIPLDYMAGCSIGVIPPAMHLLGKSFAEMEETLLQLQPHLTRWSVPRTSLFSNRALTRVSRDLGGGLCFEDLPLPFAMVAVDLAARTKVVLDRGPLWQAALASIALPGIFPPVVLGNQVLVDAGLHEPVPVSTVREMGADILLAVELSPQEPTTRTRALQEAAEAAEVGRDRRQCVARAPHIVDLLLRSYEMAMATISAHSVREADVVIRPQVHHVPLRQFSQGRNFVAAGSEAVEEALPSLREYLPWLS